MKLTVGITGATGAIYGIRLLEALKKYNVTTYVIISKWAKETITLETDYEIDYVCSLADRVFSNDDLAAALSSGSFHTDGMVIAPCSMKTIAGIASGYTDNLIIRAADVTLKECRKLVLVARETPLNVIHLENMCRLAKAGAVIMPPVPSFYSKPETIDDIVNHTVGRLLDLFGIYDNNLAGRWQDESGDKQ
jgi:4-hydroxy-3-polyprenylbenzoate decarboxylase